MRKILAIIFILCLTSTAFAEVNMGSSKLKGTEDTTLTVWADPDGNASMTPPKGIINSTGATMAYGTLGKCGKGAVVFGDITGTGIMNVAMQVSIATDNTEPPVFYNSIGSTSTPYHPLDPTDTDTYKFDFNSRDFNYWRLNCLAGCTASNYIETAFGECKEEE